MVVNRGKHNANDHLVFRGFRALGLRTSIYIVEENIGPAIEIYSPFPAGTVSESTKAKVSVYSQIQRLLALGCSLYWRPKELPKYNSKTGMFLYDP